VTDVAAHDGAQLGALLDHGNTASVARAGTPGFDLLTDSSISRLAIRQSANHVLAKAGARILGRMSPQSRPI
jgi:hypothetical protein